MLRSIKKVKETGVKSLFKREFEEGERTLYIKVKPTIGVGELDKLLKLGLVYEEEVKEQ